MEISAGAVADLFVELAQQKIARVGYRNGVKIGTGFIPYDTGATQNSIFKSMEDGRSAIVQIGNQTVNYVGYLQNSDVLRNGEKNRHKDFVQRFVKEMFVPVLESVYKCRVEIK